jgi:hypothetical protein
VRLFLLFDERDKHVFLVGIQTILLLVLGREATAVCTGCAFLVALSLALSLALTDDALRSMVVLIRL